MTIRTHEQILASIRLMDKCKCLRCQKEVQKLKDMLKDNKAEPERDRERLSERTTSK